MPEIFEEECMEKILLSDKGRKEIDQLIARLESQAESYPSGHLKIFIKKGKPYYLRLQRGQISYIPKEQAALIQALAQKDYEKKVLKNLQCRRAAVEAFASQYPGISVEGIYEKLSPERKRLVTPVMETDEAYADRWQQQIYTGRGFQITDSSGFYSERGERVRSKSEVIIANFLSHAGIPYRYECPVYLKDKTFYPDFTILDVKHRKELYLEHFGMMDDPDYANLFVRKIQVYQENGIYPGEQLLMTFETKQRTLNTMLLKQLVEHGLAQDWNEDIWR